MSVSKIALFAFALASVVAAGFSHADAAPRHAYSSFDRVDTSAEAARLDHAKGYVQGY